MVRLAAVAEELAATGVGAAEFAARYAAALELRSRSAVGLKTVVAYRFGLDLDPEPPSTAEVSRAAGARLRSGRSRLDDPTLLRFVIWTGVEHRLPLQVHTGFGDPDAMSRFLDDAEWPPAEAMRVATMIGHDNAVRVYGL